MPLSGQVIAIVRAVELGRRRQVYYRAVTSEADRTLRTLIGYWGSPQDAHDGALALYEQSTGCSVAGGGAGPSMELVPQKPPPADPQEAAGMAARPRYHSRRR